MVELTRLHYSLSSYKQLMFAEGRRGDIYFFNDAATG